jgi:hypothetical protein
VPRAPQFEDTGGVKVHCGSVRPQAVAVTTPAVTYSNRVTFRTYPQADPCTAATRCRGKARERFALQSAGLRSDSRHSSASGCAEIPVEPTRSRDITVR